MKKINIIKKNKEFQNILNLRNKYQNKYYNIYINKKLEKHYRIGISVPKKTSKAVDRNKIKRQIKEILDKNEFNKELDYIIITNKHILNLSYIEKKENLIELLKKIGEKYEKK